jgi:LuxR family maltose regulon positive regulatory protein
MKSRVPKPKSAMGVVGAETWTGDSDRRVGLGRPGTITRDRLVSRLLRGEESDCVVVVAPGGYGKTTLLAEWAEADERDVAWLTLDERHDDPAALITAMVTAVAMVAPIDESVLAPLALPQPQDSRNVVSRLCSSLEDLPQIVVVLDDAHLVRSASGRDVLARFARRLPTKHRLVLSARAEPEIRLGSLRTERNVMQLGMEELAMTCTEASRLFRACGQPLSREIVTDLVERTEGWPAALHLAAVWLAGEADTEGAAADFAGDNRLVADYLRDEFLSRLDEPTLEFLISAAALDRLTGEVCDFVLERDGSAEDLRRLSHSNLHVIPLDDRDHEFRYHALLREMLRAELHRRGEPAEHALHSRASRWYAEHGDTDRAVDHAIASGDSAAAGELIWETVPSYSWTGRHHTLVRWMAAFSEEQIRKSAPLCVSAAAVALLEGDGAEVERWALAGERALAGEKSDGDGELRASIALIRAVPGTENGVLETAGRLAEIRDRLSAHSSWRSLAYICEGALRYLGGDRDRAQRALAEAVRIGSSTGPNPASVAIAQLALVALDDEEIEGAWAKAHQALGSVEYYGLQDYPTSGFQFAVAALAGARRGDPVGARRHATRASELLMRNPGLPPWYEAQTRIALARTLVLLDDVASAREQAAVAARICFRYDDAIVLRSWLDATLKAADAAGIGRWPLTPAEVRLLQYLPTHQSFPSISAALFVSTNTVKTQAQSIYRKFDVSSRAEAVVCARAAGLLMSDASLVQEGASAPRRPAD